MATYEENENVIKLKGSCEWTKVYFDEEEVSKGHHPILTDTDFIKYRLESCLGHGFEGEVWKVRKVDHDLQPFGPFYALKFEIGDVDIGKHLKAEYDILSSLDHPYIIKAIKYWYSSLMGPPDDDFPRGHMLTLYIPGPHIDKAKFSYSEAKQALMDLITVVKYLNVDVKIYHGDIKGDNIIMYLDASIQHPVLIDFGFPGPIEKQPLVDRKSLGFIYLLLIGQNETTINKFRKNLNWFSSFSKIYDKDEIDRLITPIVRLTPQQLDTLTAFFNGTDYDLLLQIVNEKGFSS